MDLFYSSKLTAAGFVRRENNLEQQETMPRERRTHTHTELLLHVFEVEICKSWLKLKELA